MEQIVQAVAALVAISNPIGAAPVFASMTAGRSPASRRKAALSVVIAVLVILTIAAFAGTWILKAFGVTLPAFQAAGGLVVLLMGLEMLHGSPTKMQHSNEHKADDPDPDPDPGDDDDGDSVIVPLAIPMVAGPGTITTVITLTSHNKGMGATIDVLIASGVLAALLLGILLAATWLDQKMSKSAHVILLRLMGLVLVAIGAQLVLSGLRASGAMG